MKEKKHDTPVMLDCHTGKMLAKASIRQILQAKQPASLRLGKNLSPIVLYTFMLCLITVTYKPYYIWVLKVHKMINLILKLLLLNYQLCLMVKFLDSNHFSILKHSLLNSLSIVDVGEYDYYSRG